MAEHNIPLIVMMIIAIVLLFAAMVLSAMASADAKKDCPKADKAEKYSMYAAVVAGLAVFLIGIALLIYIFRKPAIGKVGQLAGSAAKALQGHADALQQHAAAVSSAAAAAAAPSSM